MPYSTLTRQSKALQALSDPDIIWASERYNADPKELTQISRDVEVANTLINSPRVQEEQPDPIRFVDENTHPAIKPVDIKALFDGVDPSIVKQGVIKSHYEPATGTSTTAEPVSTTDTSTTVEPASTKPASTSTSDIKLDFTKDDPTEVVPESKPTTQQDIKLDFYKEQLDDLRNKWLTDPSIDTAQEIAVEMAKANPHTTFADVNKVLGLSSTDPKTGDIRRAVKAAIRTGSTLSAPTFAETALAGGDAVAKGLGNVGIAALNLPADIYNTFADEKDQVDTLDRFKTLNPDQETTSKVASFIPTALAPAEVLPQMILTYLGERASGAGKRESAYASLGAGALQGIANVIGKAITSKAIDLTKAYDDLPPSTRQYLKALANEQGMSPYDLYDEAKRFLETTQWGKGVREETLLRAAKPDAPMPTKELRQGQAFEGALRSSTARSMLQESEELDRLTKLKTRGFKYSDYPDYVEPVTDFKKLWEEYVIESRSGRVPKASKEWEDTIRSWARSDDTQIALRRLKDDLGNLPDDDLMALGTTKKTDDILAAQENLTSMAEDRLRAVVTSEKTVSPSRMATAVGSLKAYGNPLPLMRELYNTVARYFKDEKMVQKAMDLIIKDIARERFVPRALLDEEQLQTYLRSSVVPEVVKWSNQTQRTKEQLDKDKRAIERIRGQYGL